MGKNNLVLGTARGKLGDIVFYRAGGEQRFRTRVRPNNPRTDAQCVQRCIVSTAVKFYSLVVDVCDHAFQNFEGRLKNHQRYMRLNIDYLRKVAKRDILANGPIIWAPTNVGNFTWKDSENIAINAYQVSEGDIPSIATEFTTVLDGTIPTVGGEFGSFSTLTYQDVCDGLNLEAGDQLTFMMFGSSQQEADTGKIQNGYIGSVRIGRIILMPSNGNMNELFFKGGSINLPNIENRGEVTLVESAEKTQGSGRAYLQLVALNDNYAEFYNQTLKGFAVIASRNEGKTWKRSTQFVVVNPDCANLETLKSAVLSYLPSDTSSLYLNQSKDGVESTQADLRVDQLVAMSERVIVEEETKTPKRTKKSEE